MDQAQYDQLKDSWADVEDRDGVRLSWNVIASSKMEANRLVVPIRFVPFVPVPHLVLINISAPFSHL